jgi:hypothetical protein
LSSKPRNDQVDREDHHVSARSWRQVQRLQASGVSGRTGARFGRQATASPGITTPLRAIQILSATRIPGRRRDCDLIRTSQPRRPTLTFPFLPARTREARARLLTSSPSNHSPSHQRPPLPTGFYRPRLDTTPTTISSRRSSARNHHDHPRSLN